MSDRRNDTIGQCFVSDRRDDTIGQCFVSDRRDVAIGQCFVSDRRDDAIGQCFVSDRRDVTIGQCFVSDRRASCAILIRYTTLCNDEFCLLPQQLCVLPHCRTTVLDGIGATTNTAV